MKRCKKCGITLSYPKAIDSITQTECNYCKNFRRKEFLGESALLKRLGTEKVGVTVSGGKDSLYVWHWLVNHLGSDKVVAFNHRKVGAVHDLALQNMNRAAEILQTEFVVIEDHTFYPRFVKNLNSYLKTPNAAVMRAMLCAGCRDGISNRIFEECKKYNINKVVNGASYLEMAPFKGYEMAKLGDGSEVRGLLNGLLENDDYLTQENLEVIIRDHFNCHDKDLSNRQNKHYVDYIDFYNYFENNPKDAKALVVAELDWKYPPQQTWRFDCIVEDYKQIFYYAVYGYSELDFKYSEMVRYELISRDDAIAIVNRQNDAVLNSVDKLVQQLCDLNFSEDAISSFRNICECAKSRG